MDRMIQTDPRLDLSNRGFFMPDCIGYSLWIGGLLGKTASGAGVQLADFAESKARFYLSQCDR